MIHGPDGAKLSKRHGAQARAASSPRWATCPRRCATTWRGLAGGTATTRSSPTHRRSSGSTSPTSARAPARLDWAKLGHVNNHYIRQADDARLAALVARGASRAAALDRRRGQAGALARAIPLVKEGAKTILELADLTIFALQAPAAGARRQGQEPARRGDPRPARAGCATRLATNPNGSPPSMNAALRAFAESEGVGLGKIGAGAARACSRADRAGAGPRQRTGGARPRRESGPNRGCSFASAVSRYKALPSAARRHGLETKGHRAWPKTRDAASSTTRATICR